MRKLACLLAMMLLPGLVGAAEENLRLMNAQTDLSDKASLQRGAKYFVNYCLGCHSLKYLRYQRLGQDLDIPDELVEKYLIWGDSKISSPITSAMREKDANGWLGAAPLDLTLVIRRRSGGLDVDGGADWLFTYLNTFYRDDKTATGVNNLVIPNASMPHVLWRLQGIPEPVYQRADGDESSKQRKVVGLKMPDGGGALSKAEYQRMTRDIVNFLAYASEPIQTTRKALGLPVLLFLIVFLAIIYLLKQEYWKDVH
ncbi:cytochrome c1 [Nitrococcus mobilis]|uniref:Cytochrome c1 n=1 Tax=Nitrococcus mobilis Nb-231 TaxID=314278 RepID=A4BQK2_9GAMM|nr:cytochrome c1 [Nitrococcus mobilis]EAR21852.1 cytochrome c1 [Nitrococcus mobilis Nb-231]